MTVKGTLRTASVNKRPASDLACGQPLATQSTLSTLKICSYQTANQGNLLEGRTFQGTPFTLQEGVFEPLQTQPRACITALDEAVPTETEIFRGRLGLA